MYYITENRKIVLYDEDLERLQTTIELFMPQYKGLVIKETDRPIDNFEFADTETYRKKKEAERRDYLDGLTVESSDFERALYKSHKMDFDDLKQLISEERPTWDMKRINIELKASQLKRNLEIEDTSEEGKFIRFFDGVGELLGYTYYDIDSFFLTKEFPVISE